jgi:hypothetical protein
VEMLCYYSTDVQRSGGLAPGARMRLAYLQRGDRCLKRNLRHVDGWS